MDRLAVGVGVCRTGKYPTKNIDGNTLEYKKWYSMLLRCYGRECQTKYPAYHGCTVSQDFIMFQEFAEWCNNQTGFRNKGWHLDKDILYKGNKQYNRDTCCFVPEQINYLILDNRAVRGGLPLGVCKVDKKFKAVLRTAKGVQRLGRYPTPEQAFTAYKEAKESYIKEVANQWKNDIDSRVYDSLISWEVDISD